MSLLRPLRETTATSIGLTRERLATIGKVRLVVSWLIQAAVLLVVGWVVPGILVEDLFAALIGALVLGLLNALVRPALLLLTIPLTVLSAGFLSLVINAIVLVLAAPLVPGLEVSSPWSAIAAATLITVLSTTIEIALASDQDDSFYAELTRRLASLDRPRIDGGRGLVIIQIDGLAAPILRNAIRVGLTPTMARWVRSGAYRLREWECSPPTQTSASQAGILHGNNDDIPAFRWYEKDRRVLMVSNRPADAAEIERRLSVGPGLLAAGGMSAGNLFSGGAPRTLFTMSRIRERSSILDVDALGLFFVDPSAFVRTVARTVAELAKEWSEARRQRALDVQPRVHRGAGFAVLRSVSNVLLRDLNVTFVVNAIGRGTPIMYVDFVDYDELAHHAGPERLESLRSLAGVDRVLASIERAMARAPRDYRLVVLSDHGQSQGATFRQRYGRSLEDVVRDLVGGGVAVGIEERAEGWGPVNALLTEIANRPGMTGRATTAALGRRVVDGSVELGTPDGAIGAGDVADADVVVAASGNLANVYLPVSDERLTLEAIEAYHPGLVAGLAGHPGIGFVLVRSETLGPLALGSHGTHELATGRIEGEDPLAPFGPSAPDQLRRLDGFGHVGDLLVNSRYWADLEEVAAFEELVGSHGGFGGPQTRPFILAPMDLEPTPEPIVGAPAVHRQLVAWADALGVGPTSGATDAPLVDRGPLAPARGLDLVVLLTALTSLAVLALGLLVGFGALATGAGLSALLAIVLTTLGIGGLIVTYGLRRRRPWARIATLSFYALSMVQLLGALATEGLAGFASVGIVPAILTMLVFFYLNRPYVKAAFVDPPR